MTTDESGPAPSRSSRRGRERRKKGGVIAFLLVSAVPIGAVAWYLMQPPETQSQIAGLFEGSGGRAAKAGICLALLIALAKVALPAFHGASGFLRGLLAWFREKSLGLKIVLFPVHLVVWLLWFVTQILFAVDAIMIVATGILFLVLVVRIVDPSILADVLPEILS